MRNPRVNLGVSVPVHFSSRAVAFLFGTLIFAACTADLAPSAGLLEVTVSAWRTPDGALRVDVQSAAAVAPLERSRERQPRVVADGAELSGRWHGQVAEPGWRFVGAFPVAADAVWVSWPKGALRSAIGATAPEELGRLVQVAAEPRPDPPLLRWGDLPPLEHGCGCHSALEGPPPRLDRVSLLSTGPARLPNARWVEPGEPAESWLLFSLVQHHPLRRGPQMPPPWSEEAAPDVDALLRALEAWVVAGARPP